MGLNVLPVLILAISSNIDDLGVGFSLGLRGRKPSVLIITVVAIVSGLTMMVGMMLGSTVAVLISESIASFISALVFAGVAVWFLLDDDDNELATAEEVAATLEPALLPTLKRGVVLGIALGVDSVVIGFSGGLAGYSILYASVLAALTSWSLIYAGSRLGYLASKKAGKYGPFIAAALLFALAIKELVA